MATDVWKNLPIHAKELGAFNIPNTIKNYLLSDQHSQSQIAITSNQYQVNLVYLFIPERLSPHLYAFKALK